MFLQNLAKQTNIQITIGLIVELAEWIIDYPVLYDFYSLFTSSMHARETPLAIPYLTKERTDKHYYILTRSEISRENMKSQFNVCGMSILEGCIRC